MRHDVLKEIRKSLNLTAKDVYEDICDRRTYYKIEYDLTFGKLDTILKICSKLGLSYQDLFFYYEIQDYNSQEIQTIESDVLKSIETKNKDKLEDSIKKITEIKFSNPKNLRLYTGLKSISKKITNRFSLVTPKEISEIDHYYSLKRGKYLFTYDYQSFSNLLPSLKIETAKKLEKHFIPINKNKILSSAEYDAVLVIYGNYIDKCLEENRIDKAFQLVRQYEELPKHYKSFELQIWLEILGNLVLYKKAGDVKFFLAAMEYFKLMKLTKNEQIISVIEKQLQRISTGVGCNKELLLIIKNNGDVLMDSNEADDINYRYF